MRKSAWPLSDIARAPSLRNVLSEEEAECRKDARLESAAVARSYNLLVQKHDDARKGSLGNMPLCVSHHHNHFSVLIVETNKLRGSVKKIFELGFPTNQKKQ